MRTGDSDLLYGVEGRQPAVARGGEGSAALGGRGVLSRCAPASSSMPPSYPRSSSGTRTGTLSGQRTGLNRLDRLCLHGAMRTCCLARRRRSPRVGLPAASALESWALLQEGAQSLSNEPVAGLEASPGQAWVGSRWRGILGARVGPRSAQISREHNGGGEAGTISAEESIAA